VIELRIGEAAARSIVEQADFYREALDVELAARWELAIDDMAYSLIRMPERGTLCRSKIQH